MARRASIHRSQPTQLTSRGIGQAVALLDNLEQQRQANCGRYPTVRPEEPDEDPDSASPIYDAFLETQGANGIHTMTNFSLSEFNVLWADVRTYFTKHWNVGSGRKSEVSARDMLLMLLTSMKHCGSWDVVAVTFKQHSPTFQKRTMSFAKALHPFVLRKYVTTVGERCSMALLTTSGHQFANFPFVRYATDVTFQQTNVPSGSYAEKKTYFSGKHSQYAIKSKFPVSDKAIFDDNLEFYVSALSKKATEDRIADHGDEGTNQWAVIADKGYQGI
ncbi:hypothetical protein DYB30_014133 [Aphanomyces astaci]|uniref:DDE Tnp4 domain-containing protein n=1 Tax=Aphanomyces astaci TaxID=112090 RepID=A0A397E372_APHAT|nr:hypothetical protein DYB30_014133 [Aphanomyces astaci]